MELTEEMRNKVDAYIEATKSGTSDICEALEREYNELDPEMQEKIIELLKEHRDMKAGEDSEPMLGSHKPVLKYAPFEKQAKCGSITYY